MLKGSAGRANLHYFATLNSFLAVVLFVDCAFGLFNKIGIFSNNVRVLSQPFLIALHLVPALADPAALSYTVTHVRCNIA
jgi:uncharacterized membrane protein YhaH (DUF805 family)